MAITSTITVGSNHPRRFSVERDMSTGLYDVWDAHLLEYVACDLRRTAAERTADNARTAALVECWKPVARAA